MYTMQEGLDGLWEICDPDGDVICEVVGEYAAQALLTHLNR